MRFWIVHSVTAPSHKQFTTDEKAPISAMGRSCTVVTSRLQSSTLFSANMAQACANGIRVFRSLSRLSRFLSAGIELAILFDYPAALLFDKHSEADQKQSHNREH